MTHDPHSGLRIDAWIDGELDPSASAAVAAHVAACADCTAAVDEVRAVALELSTPAAGPDGLFVARVVANARRTHRPLLPLWWVSTPPAWRLAFAALGLAAALGGTWVGGRVPAAVEPLDTLAASLQAPEIEALRGGDPADSGVTPVPSAATVTPTVTR